MQAVKIEERIRVGVAFDCGNIKPMWFRWKDRYYKIKEIAHTWSSNNGEGKVRHFAVSDGINLFELCFNSRTMEWILGKVSSE